MDIRSRGLKNVPLGEQGGRPVDLMHGPHLWVSGQPDLRPGATPPQRNFREPCVEHVGR